MKTKNVQFTIQVKDDKILEKKMGKYGFKTYSSFYQFITQNFIEDNVTVTMKPERKWRISKKMKEELEQIENESFEEIKNVKKWAKSL